MNLSPMAQATLLLTSYFSLVGSQDTKPLSNAEWGRFALWLKDQSLSPADLLTTDPKPLLNGWSDARISSERVLQLLNRGHSLALAVEKWQRAGLWVVTRSDTAYPWRLKKRLKNDCPPVLFGCGNKALLNAGGLAVIGSRNANDIDLNFTQQVGAMAAGERVAIVSGGARGVDETAMLGSIHHGGRVIGVLADSLLKTATSAKWRNGLIDNNVVLVSPFYPEAGFNAGNAMGRNKYIYCLADSSLVIHSGKKGGTLNGAEENLRKHWVPLWIKPTDDREAANGDLVSKGGRWCEPDIQSMSISDLFLADQTPETVVQSKKEQIDLFSQPEIIPPLAEAQDLTAHCNNNAAMEPPVKAEDKDGKNIDFYQLFIIELQRVAAQPITLDELLENTGLNKSQLNDWLKRATDEGVIKKLSKPLRFQSEIIK